MAKLLKSSAGLTAPTPKTVGKGVVKKSGKPATPAITVDDVARMAAEYKEISEQVKILDTKKKDLSDKIKEYSEKLGVKDDNGSFYLECGDFITGKVARVSMNINQEDAVKILEAMGLGDVVDEKVTKTVNEQRLEQAVAEKRCTIKTVEGFTEKNTTYQVSVKQKEEMPEVDTSQSFKTAASRK